MTQMQHQQDWKLLRQQSCIPNIFVQTAGGLPKYDLPGVLKHHALVPGTQCEAVSKPSQALLIKLLGTVQDTVPLDNELTPTIDMQFVRQLSQLFSQQLIPCNSDGSCYLLVVVCLISTVPVVTEDDVPQQFAAI